LTLTIETTGPLRLEMQPSPDDNLAGSSIAEKVRRVPVPDCGAVRPPEVYWNGAAEWVRCARPEAVSGVQYFLTSYYKKLTRQRGSWRRFWGWRLAITLWLDPWVCQRKHIPSLSCGICHIVRNDSCCDTDDVKPRRSSSIPRAWFLPIALDLA
jgi:hypothetical protein